MFIKKKNEQHHNITNIEQEHNKKENDENSKNINLNNTPNHDAIKKKVLINEQL